MAMMSKQNWVLLWMLPSKEALLTQKVDIANIEQRTQNSYLFIKGIVFVRTMAFFESLCRCRGLSKCSAAPRFPRPNMMNHMRLAKETIRSLSSLPLRRVESLATDTSSNKMSHQRKPLVKENITQKVSRRTSPASLTYTGNVTMPVTSKLKIVTPQEDPPCGIWPVYRLMDEDGEFRDPTFDNLDRTTTFSPAFAKERAGAEENLDSFRDFLCETYPHHATEFCKSRLLELAKTPYVDTDSRHSLLRVHRQIVRLRQMDMILMNAQRQGRISFYMTCTGEEGIHMGAASALDPQDPVLAQYREQGVLMWRGFSLDQFTNQCFGNDLDLGKGRQMPVHYGSKALQYHTVSSPLGTQLPQAVGVAYRLKLAKKPNVPICFFGDGCASTTDFHSAMNFAATLKAPVLFFCRNNGYAISTPVTDQYAGDGIVSRAPGYGMAAIRVDGNDTFAVHAAVREARAYALQNQAPVMIEAMTYRLGHHSTSDDSTRYRSADEVDDFTHKMDPLLRLQNFLTKHGLLTNEEIERMREDERFAVLEAMQKAEKRPKPHVDNLFEHVYHELPASLEYQKRSLKEHMAKYPKKYNA